MALRRGLAAGGLAAAVTLVAAFEGYRQYTYLDPVGIPTACFGHTRTATPGRTYTRAECEALLYDDLQEAERAIEQCVRVPLNNNQYAALASFTYNVGGRAFCESTLTRKLNAGDYVGACNELPRWKYAKGRELPGLVRRRAAERELCLSPVRAEA